MSNIDNEDIKVVYKVKCEPNEPYVSLSVIPKPDGQHGVGYASHWIEVKQQVMDLNAGKVAGNVSLIGRIESAGYEATIINDDEYLTALKVAELCGQPLDIMINNTVADVCGSSSGCEDIQSSTNKARESKRSSIDSDSSVEKNGFVLVDTTTRTNQSEPKSRSDSSTQFDNDLVVMTKSQIDNIKKEITIDVTKCLISKLTECLTEMTNDCDSGRNSMNGESSAGSDSRPERPQPPRSEPQIETAKVVHEGIICDNCDIQIEGIRYKCINCLDFDLCEKCKQLSSVHDKNHKFNKIERYIRGIPHHTIPQHLDFLKPFLTQATIDPENSRDLFLALDVDLNSGTITGTNSQTNTVPTTSASTQSTKQKADLVPNKPVDNDQQTGVDGEAGAGVGSQVQLKKYFSEKKANKIAKKLEKLKLKSQMYNTLLQSSDERSTLSNYDRLKPSTYGTHIPSQSSITPNKKLYLSGLLIGDETIPEGTRIPPNTRFRKTWKVRNTGTKVWTGRTTLRYVWGHTELEPFGRVTEVQAPALRPGEEGRVTIRFTTPNPKTPTRYQSHWRLHHRGQPFGQRLECKVIVDPSADPLTPLAPILSKESKSVTSHAPIPLPAPRTAPKSSLNMNPTYTVGSTNCNIESIAHIHASILESQRHLSERLKAMASAKQTAVNTNKDKVKKLTEALSAVKEIRFDLNESETIAMRSNVKSHTATPANTPFDVSPPKSPEPNSTANTFTQIEAPDKCESNEQKTETDKQCDDKADESDNESLDVLSLSSGESSDEFVLVPLPSCFDLNVPFSGVDNNGFEDIRDEDIAVNKEDDKCFEVINENDDKNDETADSDDDNTHLDANPVLAQNSNIEDTNEGIALDLTTDRNTSGEQSSQSEGHSNAETEVKDSNESQSESEPEVRPKTQTASTNPFRNSTNETENVIHVLPESIVTGALSAAAHVYNNVSRALFSRNEGSNFAWVTSPPPAAFPPMGDMYWGQQQQQQPGVPVNQQQQGVPLLQQQPQQGVPLHQQQHQQRLQHMQQMQQQRQQQFQQHMERHQQRMEQHQQRLQHFQQLQPPPLYNAQPFAPVVAPNVPIVSPIGPTINVTLPPPPPTNIYAPPTAPLATPVSCEREETPTRLGSALKQLYEMGFWNQKLNEELLEKNGMDVNDTIEDLLSPERGNRRRSSAGPNADSQPVVSHQPRNNRNGFIEEFD